MKIIHPRGAHPCPRAFRALCPWPGGCPSHFPSCPGRQLSVGPPLPSVILHFSPCVTHLLTVFTNFLCCPQAQNHKACGACPLQPRAQGRGCTGPAAPGHRPHRPGTTGVSRGPPCLPDTPPVFAAEPDHVGRAGGRPKEARRQCYSLPQRRFLNVFILNQATQRRLKSLKRGFAILGDRSSTPGSSSTRGSVGPGAPRPPAPPAAGEGRGDSQVNNGRWGVERARNLRKKSQNSDDNAAGGLPGPTRSQTGQGQARGKFKPERSGEAAHWELAAGNRPPFPFVRRISAPEGRGQIRPESTVQPEA